MQLISNERNLLARPSVFIILARGLNDRVSFFTQTVIAIVFKISYECYLQTLSRGVYDQTY